VQELRGEKIDIVEFDEDPARFVCEAVKPAEVSRVIIDEANHAMELIVPDDQLSLAIGRSGQNVRLAAQLTGWKLDINSESRVKELREFASRSLGALPGMNEVLIETLYAHGFRMSKDIAEANAEVLAQIPGLDAAKVAAMQDTARSRMVDDAGELSRMEKEREQRRLEEERKHPDELSQEERLARVRGIGTTNVDAFKQAGYGTVEELVKETDLTRLGNVGGIGIKKARQIKTAADHYLQEEMRRRTELDALKLGGAPAAPAAPVKPSTEASPA
jgi:N utilization substance protein A